MSDLIQVIILALIQGLTEFLPISSSAHLLLPSLLLGWQDRGLAFDVAVHFGSLLAVIYSFRQQLLAILKGFYLQLQGQDNTDSKLGVYLIIATIPACIAGLIGNDYIEQNFRNLITIAITTILGALLLWYADSNSEQKTIEITFKIALILGLVQALALIPGTSRSGIVLTFALLLGFGRSAAARFSFLMSIPIIALGAGYQLLKLYLTVDIIVIWQYFVIAIVVSAISAWLCIKLFMTFIENSSLKVFVFYRLLLGVVLLGLWLM